MNEEVRKFPQHPTDIPIELPDEDDGSGSFSPMTNVSLGGCVVVDEPTIPGQRLKVIFPHIDLNEKLEAKVAWCAQHGDRDELGLAFTDEEEAFRGRMCEQICHIEQYRLDVRSTEDRELSAEDAATEWISKCAHEFPR